MAKLDLPQGTLDLLVLQVLSAGEMHGWGVAQKLSLLSNDALQLQEGTLYPALQAMEMKGWVKSEWRLSPTKRRARYYSITPSGRKQLTAEARDFDQVVAAVSRVMKPA